MRPTSEKPARRVLLVDDEPMIRVIVARKLRAMGLLIEMAGTSDEAIAKLEAGRSFDLLFTDYLRPGRPVAELISRFRAACPKGRVVMCSGLSPQEAESASAVPDVFLFKPFEVEELREAIETALASPT